MNNPLTTAFQLAGVNFQCKENATAFNRCDTKMEKHQTLDTDVLTERWEHKWAETLSDSAHFHESERADFYFSSTASADAYATAARASSRQRTFMLIRFQAQGESSIK